MITPELLYEFRGEVSTPGWCYHKYKNNNNRNQWNCICSAMDWIEVSINYIIDHPLDSIGAHESIEVYSFLSCVDIVVEAIEQLHRVVFSTKNCVFEKDRECFLDNQFEQNDREYFKTLRACFGAHPVNLQDPDDTEAKRFASWSGGHFGSDNFSVILYSNRIDGPSITLGMNYKQIYNFLEKYYNHLQTLKCELQRQYLCFCDSKRKQPIEFSNDPIHQLKILKEESFERLNNDYYRSTIDDLILLFETPISCDDNIEMVSKYRDQLRTLIDEIYINLQSMTLVDLKNDPLLSSDTHAMPNGWGYALEKLSNAVYGSGYPEFFWVDKVERCFGDKFEFKYKSIQELYVLVHACLYQINQE